jgi:hypothetical protein
LKFAEIAPYLAAFVFNLTLVVLRVYELSYDAFTHLFFANHYANDWFGIWDSRWYGGFYMTGYTPLSHQIMALLSFISGISLPYGILSIATALFLIWATQSFGSALGMRSKSIPWIVALAPPLYMFLYLFGQLPAVLCTAFILASSSYLSQYVDDGGYKRLLFAALLAALSFFTHELVTVLLLPPLLIILLSKSHSFVAIKRLAAWGIISLAIAAPVMLDFLSFLRTSSPQAPIPHVTRGDFLVGPASLPFFWGIYGSIILLLPLAFFTLLDLRKRVYSLVAGSFIILGLGGVTPIPLAIFGSAIYNLLTYEKFSFWGAILLAIPLGVYADRFVARDGGWFRKKFTLVLVLSLFLSSVGALFAGYSTVLSVTRPDVQQISSYLNTQQGDGFYVTLGLGPLSKELSIIATKTTLDWGYNTARRLPVLSQSRVDDIDGAKYFPGGMSFVSRVLNNSLGVRWVVLGDTVYQPLVVYAGFIQVHQVNGSLPVTIWERANQAGGNDGGATAFDTKSYTWGLLPMLTLVAAVLVSIRMS